MKTRTGTTHINDIYPRTAEGGRSSQERKKEATFLEGALQGGFAQSINSGVGAGSTVQRVPSRRYYDPTLMSSSLYLPRDFKLKNKWRRWFYVHDPVTGMVLDTHAEMTHSGGEVICEDHRIKRHAQDMFDEMQLFTNLPLIDLEYMKIGEVTLYDLWDNTRGMFVQTVIHNPDFVEVSASQLAPDQPVVELRPSTDLKRLVMSTNPRDLQLKKRIPRDILSRVATGRNIPLEPEYTTRLTRLANPYDIRGTSMIDRIFRTLMYEDKIFEAQITVADNFIFPLKIFKLGDATTGWIPSEDHMTALQELLVQQHFDPNFAIIFHYGLQFEQHGLEGKILRLDREWDRIDKIKMVALGVSQNFLYGESTFACFVEDSPVVLSNGTSLPIKDVQVGDQVFDKDGKIETVEAQWCEGVPEKLCEIELWGGKKLTTTLNHNYPVWAWNRKCSCGCGQEVRAGRSWIQGHQFGTSTEQRKLKKIDAYCDESRGIPFDYEPLQKLQAQDIKPHDYLLMPKKFIEFQPESFVTKDHAWLLGLYVAEGCFSYHKGEINSVTFNLGYSERDTLAVEAKERCEKLGMTTFLKTYEHSSTTDVRNNRMEYSWFYKFLVNNAGKYSIKKQLSQEVMQWPLNLKAELVKGMYRGDGCKSPNYGANGEKPQQQVQYSTSSFHLAEQLELILLQLGIYSRRYAVTENVVHTEYIISVYGQDANKLLKLVWGNDAYTYESGFRSQHWQDDSHVYVKVKNCRIVYNIEQKKVYNLTVSGSHSYLVSNIATYNSANAALQVLLSRYQAKRGMFEQKWIKKLLKHTAKQNEWYVRSKREINAGYRVGRKHLSEPELDKHLIIPQISWKKKLQSRDDQQFLNWISGFYKEGKGPVSHSTVLSAAGLDLEDEIKRKKSDRELEDRIGQSVVARDEKGPGAKGGKLPVGPEPSESPEAGLPPLPEAAFKGVREKVAQVLSWLKLKKDKGKIANMPSMEEMISLLRKGREEYEKELAEVFTYAPELKAVLEDDFFLGKEAKPKRNHVEKFGVLINTQDTDKNDVDYFFNTINTFPFGKSYENNIAFTYGDSISSKFVDYQKQIKSQMQSLSSKKRAGVSTLDDFLVDCRNNFSESIRNATYSLYNEGKLYSYKKTNYLIYKNFLRRQYQLEGDLTSDGFVDKIVVEENSTLYDYILKSILEKLTLNQSIEDVDSAKVTQAILLLTKVILLHIFHVGVLKGYEEQGFEEVISVPCNPDILSFSEGNHLRLKIAEIFSAGESAFRNLYINSFFFDVDPAYSSEYNLPDNFNDRLSFVSSGISVVNCPYVYSDFLSKFIEKFKPDFTSITFVKQAGDISNLSELLQTTVKDIKDPQIKMAKFQTRIHEISSKPMFVVDKNLYITTSNFSDTFEKDFCKFAYPYLKFSSQEKEIKSMYNLEGFDDLISTKAFDEFQDGIYKIGSKLPDKKYSKEFISLVNLVRDFNLEENFLWNKKGEFLSDFPVMIEKDYFSKIVPILLKKESFIQKYYPSHFYK